MLSVTPTEVEELKLEHVSYDVASKALAKEAFFAGLTGGLASAVIGSRLLRFNRNTTLLCGIASGALSGYYFAEAFRSTAVAQLHAEDVRLAKVKLQEGAK
ncbi:hypothetical protein FA15DRAFT_61508 [Coprinopsis marcescibilis]|uniref:Uncharacterized protein n=1 Tax=Coprinopsis marcescibilis TaxID=230819 RepID=A0A5C3L8S2_COPMA|nr:hypothetical protein FA15DRAFT_61508 [Coprinopsis marcescibilis]